MRMFRATTIVNAAHAVGCVLSYAGQIHHEIEDFVCGQIRQKLQIADGQDDPIKLKAMVKHWSQQMSAAVNRKASRNVIKEMLPPPSTSERTSHASQPKP